MKEEKYQLKSLKGSSKEARICEALILIANELSNISAQLEELKK